MKKNQNITYLFASALEQHGPQSPQAVLWGTRKTQYFRFKILCDIADLFGSQVYTILDYGCGLGDLLEYLRFQGFRGDYIGVDITKELIHEAKKKFRSDHQSTFIHIHSERDVKKYRPDFFLLSGVFNIQDSGVEQKMRDALRAAFKQSRLGGAMNVLSTFAAHRSKGMHYVNPFTLATWCMKELTPFVTVRHDYRGGNATLYLYKEKGVDF